LPGFYFLLNDIDRHASNIQIGGLQQKYSKLDIQRTICSIQKSKKKERLREEPLPKTNNYEN